MEMFNLIFKGGDFVYWTKSDVSGDTHYLLSFTCHHFDKAVVINVLSKHFDGNFFMNSCQT